MKKLLQVLAGTIFVILLFSSKSFGLDTNSIKYMPLQVGNYWTYFFYESWSGHENYYYGRCTVTHSIIRNNHIYYYLDGVFNGYYRTDSITGSLYRYDSTNSCPNYYYETFRDSLAAVNGALITACANPNPFFRCLGTGAQNVFGDTTHYIRFQWTYPKQDMSGYRNEKYYSWKYGLFREETITSSWGQPSLVGHVLKGCKINGRLYGDTTVVIDIGTNIDSIVNFSVNNVTYNKRQSFILKTTDTLNVKALSPYTTTTEKYTFVNWSDGGDTAHNITASSDFSLTAYYKPAYKLVIVNSIPGSTYGGNIYYDSAVTFSFGVNSKRIIYNGEEYIFKGWSGTGPGSYTSPDSSGVDSVVTMSMSNFVIERPIWQSTVGIKNLSNDIPDTWNLNQNYPNPFNPVTNIRFDVPSVKQASVFVNLKVYDVMGREIQTLVNESLKPGTYEVTFNGSKLNSGVYFYKLMTDSFSETKKMLMIK